MSAQSAARRATTGLLALAAALLSAPQCVPPNDTCEQARLIDPAGLPFAQSVDTTGFADDRGESGPDAFWSFTPDEPGFYSIEVSAAFDSVLELLTGDCAALESQVVVDEGFAGDPESLLVPLSPAIPVTVLAEGFFPDDFGVLELRVEGPFSASANDLCLEAFPISPEELPFSQTVDTSFNTDTIDNSASLAFGGGGSPDAWWSFTPDVSATYEITTAGFDTAIAVLTGGCGSPFEVVAVDDTFGGEAVLVALEAGTEYLLLGEGFGAADRGMLTLTVDVLNSANDLCENATAIQSSDLPFVDAVDTRFNSDTIDNSASLAFGGGGSPDAWWSFTPAVSGIHVITTSGFDTAVAVLTGDCASPLEIAAVDDTFGGETLAIDLEAGTPYLLLGEGFGAADTGVLALTVDPPTSANDLCGDATAIDANALPFTDTIYTQSNSDTFDNSASLFFGGGGSPDAWWSFTPANSGIYQVQISGFDTAIAVLIGGCASALEIEAVDDTFGDESLVIALAAGTEYLLLGEGFGPTDVGLLTVELAPLATAVTVPAAGGVLVGDTGLLPESFVSGSCGGFDAPEAFFEWTPDATGDALVSTCGEGTELDTLIYVSEGRFGADGAELLCNDDACANASGLLLASGGVVSVTEGVTYTIVVDAFGTRSGPFQLEVVPPGAPLASACRRIGPGEGPG
ncbi:MAG: hypothetical protein QNK04_02900 [Myxococcota bacterium]|nr:hypothetical protein [Myxococcota bacterium]